MIMKLVKTNERVDRPFDANGDALESRLESIMYNVLDDEGNVIGNANINQYNGNANINIPDMGHADVSVNSYGSFENGEALLKMMLGIE